MAEGVNIIEELFADSDSDGEENFEGFDLEELETSRNAQNNLDDRNYVLDENSFLKSAWRHSVYYYYHKARNTQYFASWHLGDGLGVYRWPQCRYKRRFYKSHSRLSKITTGNRCRNIKTMQNVTVARGFGPFRIWPPEVSALFRFGPGGFGPHIWKCLFFANFFLYSFYPCFQITSDEVQNYVWR